MTHYQHLIVGGGMTGHAAAAAIRELDPDASIGLVGDEPDRPYARPPLTKGLWLGKDEETIWLADVPGLVLHAGRRAVALDPRAHELTDDQGSVYHYGRLLLATGGRPRRLPFGGDRVIYFRTLADYHRLRAVAGRRVTVIGGGFIGSELAAALSQAGRKVTMIFPDPTVGARVYPGELAAYVTHYFEQKGVKLVAGDAVTAIEPHGDGSLVRTRGGREVVADAVVAGLGIVPDTALAEEAGLRCDEGILVDAALETSAPDVFAAGDVARFPSAALREPVRVEHEDNAVTMGRTAGRIMAGAAETYDHLPFFYSDLFDLGYEAVGRLDARLEIVTSWKTPCREGVAYYLAEGVVKGVLLWGIFGQVEAARRLIESHRPAARDSLGLLP